MTAAVVGIGRFEEPRKSDFVEVTMRVAQDVRDKTPSCQGYARRFYETIFFYLEGI